MEDIQDGIKKSIQDGVEEDPEYIEHTDVAKKSFAGIIYILTELTVPEISLTVSTGTTPSRTETGTIGLSVAGVVT